MIVIENKRCKPETLYKKYGADAIIADVTSKAQDGLEPIPCQLIAEASTGKVSLPSTTILWQGWCN